MSERVTPLGSRELTVALAAALGLPKHTTRAVLTLTVDRPPRLDLTVLAISDTGGPLVAPDARDHAARRIQQIDFMLRLEPNP